MIQLALTSAGKRPFDGEDLVDGEEGRILKRIHSEELIVNRKDVEKENAQKMQKLKIEGVFHPVCRITKAVSEDQRELYVLCIGKIDSPPSHLL